MTQRRIYVPLNASALRALARDRQLGGLPLTACAVTRAVERAYPAADQEELEYAVLWDAVELATGMREAPGDRLVVAAADMEGRWVGPHPGERSDVPSLVHVAHRLDLANIVSLHVDEVGAGDDEELLWYDVTELPTVLGLL
jgi:hypothetical protein